MIPSLRLNDTKKWRQGFYECTALRHIWAMFWSGYDLAWRRRMLGTRCAEFSMSSARAYIIDDFHTTDESNDTPKFFVI